MRSTAHTMKAIISILVLLLCAVAPVARADDDVTVVASVEPGTVAVGEQATLTVQVKGKFRNSAAPQLPTLSDFDVYQSGTSQSFSIVNGHATSSIMYSYVLVPRSEGTFQIAPITFEVGGKQYTANPVTLDVVQARSGMGTQPAGNANGQPPSRALPDKDQSIFVTASVDADTVYVNQQVTWTLGYYTDGRVRLLRSPNYSPPTAEGFWVEDLPPQSKYNVSLHGRPYQVSELKRGYFPTAPGAYTIDAAHVDIVVDDIRGVGGMDDLFSRGFRGFGQQKSLQTDPITVTVLPLPGRGKPVDFSGTIVSDLTVVMTADKQTVQVGEPVNVSVEMKGIGNMRTVLPPKLADLKTFKVYESGSSTDSFKKDYVVSGRRKFDFVLIPQAEGRFDIPPVSVSYFDPAKGSYAVAQTAGVSLDVKPGTAENANKFVYAGGGDDFKVLNRDIRYIHSVPAGLTVAQPPFYTSRFFLALQSLPLLAVGASLVVERRRRRFRTDVGFARATRALRDADRKCGGAARAFQAGDAERGFGLLQGAIFSYFADRMNAPAAGLTSSDVDDFLRRSGADETVMASMSRVLAACNAARYAGAAGGVDGVTLTADVRTALAAAEKALR